MSENGDLKIGGKYGKWRIIEDTGRLTNWNEKIYKARSDDGKVRNIWYSTSGKKSIKDYVVIGKILQQERWKVILDAPFNGKKTMPLAHYNWLMGNPSFSEIPKGYAIHHLDNDPLNDDISNLALIHKHHHTAYHLKYKNIETKIEYRRDIDMLDTIYQWDRIPKTFGYYKRKDTKTERWVLWWHARESGKSMSRSLSSYEGKPFRREEDVIRARDEIIELYKQITKDKSKSP
jgi:hypothetical protein